MTLPARIHPFAPACLAALLAVLGVGSAIAGFIPADVAIGMTGSPDPVTAGGDVTYTITVTDTDAAISAANLSLSDSVPTNTTFTSLASPAGWNCTTPAVGTGGVVNCTNASLAANSNAVFTLVVTVDAAVPASTLLSNTATIASGNDPNPNNNSATVSTTAPVDLQSFDVD